MNILRGGNGTRAIVIGVEVGEAVLNDTGAEYRISPGYETTANGAASRIAINPGEVAVRLSAATPYDFASWGIGAPDEVAGREIHSLSTILKIFS